MGRRVKYRRSGTTYNSWKCMRSRCNNPCGKDIAVYGPKKLEYESAWDDFDIFVDDMGNRPDGMTLDRIDNALGYFRGNVRWADATTQQRNKSNNIYFTYLGETLVLQEWIDRSGMNKSTFHDRIRRGWNIRETLETPIRHNCYAGNR